MRVGFTVIFLLVATIAFAQYQPHVIWDRSGETDSSAYGYKILPLGDQNNDGYADWAVHARGNGSYHGVRDAYLEFFHGGDPPSTVPFFTFRTDSDLYVRSWDVLATGDLNGDGYEDWLIGLVPQAVPPHYTVPVFLGGPGDHSVPDFQFPVGRVTIIPIGDFNGDHFDDLMTYNQYTNVAEVYFGGNPMDTIPDWTLHQPPPGINQSIPYSVGDFNGDGYSDFLCFDSNYRAAVFLGGVHPDTVWAYMWTDFSHWPIGGVKSINGDANDEMIVRDLSDYAPCAIMGRPVLQPTLDFRFTFSCNVGGPRFAVTAGDFNRDGYNDVITYTDYCGDEDFGSLSLHLGGRWLNATPTIDIDGWSEPLNLFGIYTAAALGDVNGDSVDDFAIGAWDDLAYLGWRGRCVIIAGDSSLRTDADERVLSQPSSLVLSAYPNPFNGETTIKLHVPFGISTATLTTFNLLGQVVAKKEISVGPGDAICPYSGGDLTSGLYFLRVEAGNLQSTTKLMLMK